MKPTSSSAVNASAITDGQPASRVDLRLFSTRAGLPGGDDKGGRGVIPRALWMLVSTIVFQNPLLAAYGLKARLLRRFGARIGDGVVIKPSVTIKYPWFLEIGDHSWIGERAWLDCTAPLTIGRNVVISQGVFLCCGMHDWQDPGMGSVTAPIVVHDGAWIASFARIAGSVTVGVDAMIALGSVVFNDCEAGAIYRGNPAARVGRRQIRDYPGPRRQAEPRK